jgi:hypothetical protein
MKIYSKPVGLTLVTSVLIIPAVFYTSTAHQASAAAGGFITGDGTGSLGCPDGTTHPAAISFSASDDGKVIFGKLAITEGSLTGTGAISSGQIAKNHYYLAGNWNRGGLCGLTDSHSFSVLGAPGSSVLIQYVDVCTNCKHNFSGTVIITPTKIQ